MSEEKAWYFTTKGKSYGPCTQHELCKHFGAGRFSASDYVFCKGQMEGWVKAGEVPGLCDSLELSPEPEPEHHAVPFHEKAAFDHAQDQRKVQKDRTKRDKAFWDRLKKPKQ